MPVPLAIVPKGQRESLRSERKRNENKTDDKKIFVWEGDDLRRDTVGITTVRGQSAERVQKKVFDGAGEEIIPFLGRTWVERVVCNDVAVHVLPKDWPGYANNN